MCNKLLGILLLTSEHLIRISMFPLVASIVNSMFLSTLVPSTLSWVYCILFLSSFYSRQHTHTDTSIVIFKHIKLSQTALYIYTYNILIENNYFFKLFIYYVFFNFQWATLFIFMKINLSWYSGVLKYVLANTFQQIIQQ